MLHPSTYIVFGQCTSILTQWRLCLLQTFVVGSSHIFLLRLLDFLKPIRKFSNKMLTGNETYAFMRNWKGYADCYAPQHFTSGESVVEIGSSAYQAQILKYWKLKFEMAQIVGPVTQTMFFIAPSHPKRTQKKRA